MEREIARAIPGARAYGAGAPRVANTSFLGFEGVEKDGLVAALDLAGFCVSSGSACSSGITEPSRTLLAMGLSAGLARSAVRVSLPTGVLWEELESFVEALKQAVLKTRKLKAEVA
jgi:cysteine desulfurase